MAGYNPTKESLFDVRLLEYNLSQGIITKEEYQKYLASLPDSKENSMTVELDETATEGNTH